MILIAALPGLFLAAPAQAFLWFHDTEVTANVSNNRLLKMKEDEQAKTLTRALGGICTATDPYYMGTEKKGANAGVSFWSVTCKEKSNVQFMIAIAPDAAGNTKVIQCNLLHGQPWKCYSRID